MATSEQELVDTLSGLALFADLTRPQVEAVAHKMTEESYPTGQRILRQGFTGTGFYVIVDGEVAVKIDGNEISRLGKGDFFGEMSILLGEPPVADIVTTRQLRVLHLGGPELEGFLRDYPPVMLRMLKAVATRLAQREPMAELAARPFPPGDYPVVVVGSGPGGIQTSYYLRHLGIDHAFISADPVPGGMFRRFPFFQRLLSWTKPYGPVPRDDRFYYWFDWNSLLAEEPQHRALMPDLMDGTSSFPSRPEMELNLATFVERTGLKIRYETTWESHLARRRPLRPSYVRWRLPVQGGDLRGRGRETVQAEHARLRARGALRRHASRGDVCRQAPVHHRQGEQRL